jgi:cytosine/adenosine deaminase-related metal-dependent hydrolase
MKGLIPKETGLVDFILAILTKRHIAEDIILQSIQDAETEMIEDGIVAVGDICNTTFTLPQKKLHRLKYYNFIEVSGWHPDIANTRYETAQSNYNGFNQLSKSYHDASIVPHAPYSVSNKLWEYLKPNFSQQTITIHNQETLFENNFFEKGEGDFGRLYERLGVNNPFFIPTGKSSIQSYLQHTTNAENLILVHNTFTNENDDWATYNNNDETNLMKTKTPYDNQFIMEHWRRLIVTANAISILCVEKNRFDIALKILNKVLNYSFNL